MIQGSAEANFDALEANPYESKNQRRQWEVKALLEKIQPELITLNASQLRHVDTKTLQEKMEERNKKLVSFLYCFEEKKITTKMVKFVFIFKFLKPRKIDFEPRHKMKGKSRTGRKEARKKAVKSAALRVNFFCFKNFVFNKF